MHRAFAVAAGLSVMAMGTLLDHAPAQALSAALDDGFNDWFIAMGRAAARDPEYQRIPLDSNQQSERFVGVTHRLYRGDITPEQYRQAVHAVYPGHDYEIAFIIAHLPR